MQPVHPRGQEAAARIDDSNGDRKVIKESQQIKVHDQHSATTTFAILLSEILYMPLVAALCRLWDHCGGIILCNNLRWVWDCSIEHVCQRVKCKALTFAL